MSIHLLPVILSGAYGYCWFPAYERYKLQAEVASVGGKPADLCALRHCYDTFAVHFTFYKAQTP